MVFLVLGSPAEGRKDGRTTLLFLSLCLEAFVLRVLGGGLGRLGLTEGAMGEEREGLIPSQRGTRWQETRGSAGFDRSGWPWTREGKGHVRPISMSCVTQRFINLVTSQYRGLLGQHSALRPGHR